MDIIFRKLDTTTKVNDPARAVRNWQLKGVLSLFVGPNVFREAKGNKGTHPQNTHGFGTTIGIGHRPVQEKSPGRTLDQNMGWNTLQLLS